MTPRADLEAELGAPPPPAFARLGPDATADLAAALAAARHRRRQARADAAERIAGLLPKRLRPRVRKGLTG